MGQLVPSPPELLSLCLKLVSFPSVTTLPGEENNVGHYIYEWVASLPYFQSHPEHIVMIPVENDPLQRFCVGAFLEASPSCSQTIILTGHFDVVGTEGFGSLASWAFEPQEYMARIQKEMLPSDVRRDLESGEYLFGRGIADMKYGLALEMACMKMYAQAREELGANLLFLAVCDEENMSSGMRSVVPWLRRFREEKGLQYIACLNTEPSVGEPKEKGALYLGTIGKLMPVFLCVGREAHVGEYFKGVSATLMASCLTVLIEGDEESADTWRGFSFPPMAGLKLADLQDGYSVTLPEMAVTFFNSLLVTKSPRQLLAYMKQRAQEALQQALALRESSGKKLAPSLFDGEPERGAVITVEELLCEVARKRGLSPKALMKEIALSIHDGKNIHQRGIEVMQTLARQWGRKGPFIVIGFLPPYYPSRCNNEEIAGEKGMRLLCEELVQKGKNIGFSLEVREIFEGIMDLSYLGFQGNLNDLEGVAQNTPLWNIDYYFPSEDILCLHIPILNMGPIGKDAHQSTERLYLPYALHGLPLLFVEALERIPDLCKETNVE